MLRVGFFTSLLLSLACATGKNPEDTDPAGPDTGDTDLGSPPIEVGVEHTGSEIVLTIVNGRGAYTFGMAETGSSADPWTGEDCLDGYTFNDGTTLRYCHPASADGVVLAAADSADAIVEGETTLMTNILPANTTYVLFDDAGECWTWGAETSYFTGCGPVTER